MEPESPEVKEVRDDLSKYASLSAILDQDGGKLLINTLKQEIADSVQTIVGLFQGDEMHLRTEVARLQAHLNLYRALKRSPLNAKLAEEELSKLLESQKED